MSTAQASRATLEQAIQLVSSGDIKGASDLCERALRDNPDDINVVALMGAVMLKANELGKAERYLKNAIELAPAFAKPHEDLGILLVRQEKFDRAIEVLEKAVRLDSQLELAYFHLGKALAAVGRGKEADAAFETSFDLSPERRALAMAAKAHKEGRYDEAEKSCREVLKKNPRNVDAMRMLALLAGVAGHLDDAERLLKRALDEAPDYLVALVDLGRLLKDQDRYEESIEFMERASALAPGNFKVHLLLANVYAPAARLEEAVVAHQRCLDINPKHPGALLGMGHSLKTLGRQQDGIDAYEKCIEAQPSSGETYWSLANLKTYQFSDAQMREIERYTEDDTLEIQSSVNFLFAMAKACDDKKDYQRAWQYYDRGNSKQRANVSYDPVTTELQNDAFLKVFSRETIERLGGLGNPDPAPIFVLGLPRSGSTLIEQILASHSQVEGTSELPYIGRTASSLSRNRVDGINYPEAVLELEARHLQRLGQDYLKAAAMHRKEGAPFFIDKMPNNFPTAGFIHLILPNAKIIDARRNPMDACVGNLRQLYAKGQNFSYDMIDIGEYYLQYQRMMDHWDEVMPGKILHVQYEETVRDLEKQVKRILAFCELPWEDSCLNFHDTDRAVRTASSEQVRQPIYTQGIGAWTRYEDHLGDLKEVLEPLLPRYQQYLV